MLKFLHIPSNTWIKVISTPATSYVLQAVITRRVLTTIRALSSTGNKKRLLFEEKQEVDISR